LIADCRLAIGERGAQSFQLAIGNRQSAIKMMATSNRIPAPRWKREAEFALRHDTSSRSQAGRELPIDKVMLAVVLGITLFGAVMVYSASAILAE